MCKKYWKSNVYKLFVFINVFIYFNSHVGKIQNYVTDDEPDDFV